MCLHLEMIVLSKRKQCKFLNTVTNKSRANRAEKGSRAHHQDGEGVELCDTSVDSGVATLEEGAEEFDHL